MKNNKGFTLLEITAVVVIITMLSTIFIAGYREGERQFALKRSANQLAQGFRKAQEMSLSNQEFMGIPQGGYGICLEVTPSDQDTGKYTLFIDCDSEHNNKFDGDLLVCQDCLSGECFPNSVSEKIEDFTLEKRIKITALMPSPLPGEPLCVTYIPPDPTVVFPGAEDALAQITLNFDNGPGRTITINKAGLIEIE